MSLSDATHPDGRPLGLGPAPISCDALDPIQGTPFLLPCDDPWLEDPDGPGGVYLQAAADAWQDHPEWMDFLDMGSPAWDLKRAERDLYLHVLEPVMPQARTVLDVGCGIGRMTQSFLDNGSTVYGVDGDLRSLQRCAWHAANRLGSLDLFWSTPDNLPDVQVDLAIAVEVLCYLEDPDAALAAMVDRVKPGGHVFVAMEARWGWALSEDAPPEGLDTALGGEPLLDLEGDRYVHLFDEDRMRLWLANAGLEIVELLPTHYLTDGPLEGLLPESMGLEGLLDLERKCRRHPVFAPLNRIWSALARKP